MVAAERRKVSLPGRVESFQSPGHKASLRLRTSPLKPKDGLSGPPENGDRRRSFCASTATHSVALFVSQFGNLLRSPSTFLLISFLHLRYYSITLVIYKIINVL